MLKAIKNITLRILPVILVFTSLMNSAMAARFYIEDNANLIKGCPGIIRVKLDSEGQNVLAADATMTYNSGEAAITNMALDIALPMQTYNKIAGAILELSGARLPATGPFNGDGLYGKISVTPDANTNTLTIGFTADLSRENVIAQEGTFANIISSATGRTFTIKDKYNKEVDGTGWCTPDITPPTVNFILPSNGQGGLPVDQANEIFSIADDRAGVDINSLSYTIEGVSYNRTTAKSASETGGVWRVETAFTEEWSEGQTINISVYVCDSNTTPSPNCGTTNGTFHIYSTPPPAPVCGDNITTYQVGEQCDDGNTLDGDGCSALCFIEVEPVVCPECEAPVQECPSAGTIIVQDSATGELLSPAAVEVTGPPVEEVDIREGVYPEVNDAIKNDIPGCTRQDIAKDIIKEFDIAARYGKKDAKCLEDIEHCMLPFLIHTAYKNADVANDRYYPDVYLQGERVEPLLKDDAGPRTPENKSYINQGTRTGMVQGFYEDTVNLSPFRPDWNMTKMQMIKALNWAVFGQQWMYEEEYYAQIGGEKNLAQVKRLASDLTEWWHPRYYNLACEMGVFNCDSATSFGPNDVCSPTFKRDLFARYKVFFEQNDDVANTPITDTDGDKVNDDDEMNVFLTDLNNIDTDNDGLDDGIEIFGYKSNPKIVDSDYDGLTDYAEVMTHKTNPILPDTDGDLYPDGREIEEGTDPLDPMSHPGDANGNGILDEWELKYGLSPQNGTVDTDGDGLSDLLEYKNGTDPTNPDTDDDGISDADEVLLFNSDPLKYTKISELGVRITNIIDGMTLTDPRPFIYGFAPEEGMVVEVILRNEFGHEILLGSGVTDVNNAWVFTPEFDILDGEFYLLAKGLDPEGKRVIESPLIGVTMNSSLKVEVPKPERLATANITDNVLLQDLRIEITDSKPTLIGRTGFKNKVLASWQSVLGTSAIVADLAGGEFRISSPNDLSFGNHTVTVYAVREADQAVSKVITVNFSVNEPFADVLKGVALAFELIFPLWVWLLILLAGFGLLGYGVYLDRKRKKK